MDRQWKPVRADMVLSDVLEDVLQPGLNIVFCGTAAGKESARLGKPYSNSGNTFWTTLHAVGLTPNLLAPADYKMLPKYGMGLTDIAKRCAGVDAELCPSDFDVPGFREKIQRFAPRVVAFNGKYAAAVFYDTSTRVLEYGRQLRIPEQSDHDSWVIAITIPA
jgi:TDG/mug DNA glycosylase family protein